VEVVARESVFSKKDVWRMTVFTRSDPIIIIVVCFLINQEMLVWLIIGVVVKTISQSTTDNNGENPQFHKEPAT
jgi:hypothetical protein